MMELQISDYKQTTEHIEVKDNFQMESLRRYGENLIVWIIREMEPELFFL